MGRPRWVKLWVSAKDHKFLGRDLSLLGLFSWLLMEANWEDGTALLKRQRVRCKRGQLVVSIRSLAAKFGMSEATLRRRLQLLEAEGVIDARSDAAGTIITICNYEKYQAKREGSDAHIDAQSDAHIDAQSDAHIADINRGVEGQKDRIESPSLEHEATEPEQLAELGPDPFGPTPADKLTSSARGLLTSLPAKARDVVNKKAGPSATDPTDFDSQIAQRFIATVRTLNEETGTALRIDEATPARWANGVRLLRTQDGISEREITRTLDWAFSHPFWRQAIQSPDSFRRSYREIRNQMAKALSY